MQMQKAANVKYMNDFDVISVLNALYSLRKKDLTFMEEVSSSIK